MFAVFLDKSYDPFEEVRTGKATDLKQVLLLQWREVLEMGYEARVVDSWYFPQPTPSTPLAQIASQIPAICSSESSSGLTFTITKGLVRLSTL